VVLRGFGDFVRQTGVTVTQIDKHRRGEVVVSPNSGPSQLLQCAQPESGVRGEDQMKKSALTEEQITYALRQGERGTPGSAVCRQLGVSAQTCSRGKRKCAGMGMAAWRRLRPLEEEHRTRKHLVADLTLDKPRLQEVL
jgi:putative transposase